VVPKDSTQILATPKVRGLARQLGIPLTNIRGTGDDGRITVEDLQPQASRQVIFGQSALFQLPGDEEQPLIGIKALMAKKMAESKAKIPHFSYFEDADATRLIQLKDNSKLKANAEGIHITYMPFILRALSVCIKKYPILNSSYDAEHSKVILHHRQNIGIAMSTPLGLIVPVLKEVEKLGVEALIRSYEELILRARSSKLLPSDMKEGTLTVSNFGSIGNHGLWATPIINYPEVAILAIGWIHQQPIVKNGLITVGDRINFSWSFDHRIIDGDLASQISKSFCSLIENPAALL
jgi:pyruvate dehydrogenase E2 component (dihydrolipoamide acetyltransferase)/2-oxoisovalerate dehydrogenase E2 component (dihydrolipoyl transacylase)